MAILERKRGVIVENRSARRMCIDAMPIEVIYFASIPRVVQRERSGETVFQTNRYMEGKEGTHIWIDQEYIDAYAVRDEFFKVTTESEALAFLRKNGAFLPMGDDISWQTFRRWQRLAELVRERDTLSAAHRESMAALRPHSSTELDEILRLLTGIYDHEYFGLPKPPPSDEIIAQWNRATEILGGKPGNAHAKFRDAQTYARNRQRELELWFKAPPAEHYSIEFKPRVEDSKLLKKLGRGGAMIDLMLSPKQLQPVLVIRPRCAIEAIAAAIYAERVAGNDFGKCVGCGEWFEIGSQKTKTFCRDSRCSERTRKARQRAKARKLAVEQFPN
jgi:hypothetical protein